MSEATDTIAPPRIHPRIARRWVEARRAEGRRRLKVLVIAGCAAVGALAAGGSLYTPLWHVRHIRVSALGSVSAVEVESIAGISHRALMVHVDTGRLVERLDAVPELGGASAARHWPSTVTIKVAVRSVLALVARPGGGWVTVDSTGRVLADISKQTPGLPLLQGVGVPPPPGQWLAGSAGPAVKPGTPGRAEVDMTAASDAADEPIPAAAALAALQSLPPGLRVDVISVTAGPGTSLSMAVLPSNFAAGSIAVAFGDTSQLAQKLDALASLIDGGQLAGVTRVDLSVPDRPATLTAR